MVKKEEYKLSADGKKEVDFVKGVVLDAQTVVTAATKTGNYSPDKVQEFRERLSSVSQNYENNVVALEQTRVDLEASRKQIVESNSTNVKLNERVATEVKHSKTLEGRLSKVLNAVDSLTSEKNDALSLYNSEKDKRETYEKQLDRTNRSLTVMSGELDLTRNILSEVRAQVDDLSTRANTRTSSVQTLLQTYFGVPESTFKGVAEDKKEEHVYKLLEEQLAARATRDKTVEEELNSVLGGTVKTDKTSETNGQKLVNRVKSAVKSGNGK